MPFIILVLVFLGGTSVGSAQEGRDHLRRRFDDMRQRRTPPGMVLPADVRARAIDAARAAVSKLDPLPLAEQPTWSFVGPASTAGRVKSILVHPQRANHLLVGAAAGGVWRSTDAGESWTPLLDDANAIAMGALCFDPSDPSTIYAGTGEQVVGANIYLGCGILRSTNDGATWSVVGLTHVGSFSRIIMRSERPQRIVAAAMNENAGVYRSEDAGRTWTRVFDGQIFDLTMPANAPDTWIAAVRGQGLVRTTDAGLTWTSLPMPAPGTIGRISVMHAPSQPTRVYGLFEIDDLAVIAVSDNGGDAWRILYRDTEGCFFSGTCVPSESQGFYDNVIAVDPENADLVLAGGIDLLRTSDGGATWENVTNGYGDANGNNHPHVDQHAITFDPHMRGSVYVGNDGGMMHSMDGGRSYQPRNTGLAITQFYGMASVDDDRSRIAGGTQDNGTLFTSGDVLWDTLQGGDGMTTIIDPRDPATIYGTGPNGDLFRVDTRTGSSRRITSGINMSEDCAWIAPLIHEPTTTTTLYTARRRVYRTDSRGDQWEPISPIFSGTVTALAVSPFDESILWAGSTYGELAVTTSNGAAWTTVFRHPLGQLTVSAIACAQRAAGLTYVAYGSYGNPQVWKTTDGGQQWTSVWDGMPNIPVNALVIHPDDDNTVIVGTDIGVFVSMDGGGTWQPYGRGLPRSPVLDLRADATTALLRVATHGRGIWEAPLPRTVPTDPIITSPAGGEVLPVGTRFTVLWNGIPGTATVELSTNNGGTWNPIQRDVAGGRLMWTVPATATSTARIRVLPTNGGAGAESRTFSIRAPEPGTVLSSRALAWTAYGLAWDGGEGLWTTDIHGSALYKLDRNTLALLRSVPMQGAGDSLFTDITFDRATGTVYVHRLDNFDGTSTTVFVLDTNGNVLRQFPSQARRYGTGLEYVDGVLWATERDGARRLVQMDPTTGVLLGERPNPFTSPFGPRCFADDGNGNLVQICTAFPPGGGKLITVLAAEINRDAPTSIADQLVLASRSGLINARGIEIDQRDATMWVSDIDGVIWKIAGPRFTPPVTGVAEEFTHSGPMVNVHPNPSTTATSITITPVIPDDALTVDVIDLTGRVVHAFGSYHASKTSSISLRLSEPDIAPGTYLIRVSSSSGSLSTRTFVRLH